MSVYLENTFKCGQREYIIEARNEDKSLAFDKPAPPFMVASENRITDYYFAKHPDKETARQGEIIQYFKSQGWTIRPKTW